MENIIINKSDITSIESLRGKVDDALLDNPAFEAMLSKVLSTGNGNITISNDGQMISTELRNEAKGANDISVFWHQGTNITLDERKNLVFNGFTNTLNSDTNNPYIGNSKLATDYVRHLHNPNGIEMSKENYSDAYNFTTNYQSNLRQFNSNLNLAVFQPRFNGIALDKPSNCNNGNYTGIFRDPNLVTARVVSKEGISNQHPLTKYEVHIEQCLDFEHPLFMRTFNKPDLCYDENNKKWIPNQEKYNGMSLEEVQILLEQNFDEFLQYTQENNPNAYDNLMASMDNYGKAK